MRFGGMIVGSKRGFCSRLWTRRRFRPRRDARRFDFEDEDEADDKQDIPGFPLTSC
jgi:hypothetical protein